METEEAEPVWVCEAETEAVPVPEMVLMVEGATPEAEPETDEAEGELLGQ